MGTAPFDVGERKSSPREASVTDCAYCFDGQGPGFDGDGSERAARNGVVRETHLSKQSQKTYSTFTPLTLTSEPSFEYQFWIKQ